MMIRFLSSLLAVALLAGCPSSQDDPKKKGKGKDDRDESTDVSFQAFVGRLQTAVARHDLPTLSGMLAPDFGYRWDASPAGEDAFSYWDKQHLWGELSRLLHDRWVSHEGFLVVPPALASENNYSGLRAGVRRVNGSWRFAYFVAGPPPEPSATPEPASPVPTAL